MVRAAETVVCDAEAMVCRAKTRRLGVPGGGCA